MKAFDVTACARAHSLSSVSTLAGALLLAGLLGCSGSARAGAAARSPKAADRHATAAVEAGETAGGPGFSAEAARAHAAGLAAFEQGDLKGAAEQFNHAIAVD